MSLSSEVNATILSGTGTGTITDDDPLPVLSVQDIQVIEGATRAQAVFTLVLSATSGREVVVDYATADDSAVAGEDYQATSGSATFAPGQGEQSVTVDVLADAIQEPDESFVLQLSGEQNVILAQAQARATITDDDERTVGILAFGLWLLLVLLTTFLFGGGLRRQCVPAENR